MTKKNALIVSVLGIVTFYIMDKSVQFGICSDISYSCRNATELIQSAVAIFIVTFFLSLITYKLPEQVFQYWWRFAVWFVPVVIAITTWFDTRHTGGSWGMPDLTTAFVHIPLYIIFIGVSLVRIGIAWREVKTGQSISLMKKAALMAAVPLLTYGTLWLMV